MKKILAISLLAWMLLAGSGKSPAQGVEDINMARSRIFIDLATFSEEDGNRLEVYYKIFNDGLHYLKRADKYVANYEINVIILGDKDKQVTGQSVDKTYVLDDYLLTRSQEGYLINQIDLKLEPGNYALICKLIDHNSNDVSTIETKFETPVFDRGGDLSDIELVQDAVEVGETSKFAKYGLSAVPMVERAFDSEEHDLGFFAEAYLGRYVGQDLTLEYEVGGGRNGTITSGSIPVASDNETAGLADFIKLGKMPPDDYELTLTLKQGGKSIAKRSTRFSVKWSLPSLVRNDFEFAVEQLKYIISHDEKKELLAAPDSLRLERFEEWWVSKDPTPGTPENELHDEYYRRIRYANQYFHAVNREGWQTDRGMVYIKYGEPDQIDRHPFELEGKPYQVWYYYTQRRTFVFEDVRGSGDYQLQYPYDGDWNRYIGD